MFHGASVEERDSAVFALKEWIAGERRATERESGRRSADDEQAALSALQWLIDSESSPPPSELMGARWIDDLVSR